VPFQYCIWPVCVPCGTFGSDSDAHSVALLFPACANTPEIRLFAFPLEADGKASVYTVGMPNTPISDWNLYKPPATLPNLETDKSIVYVQQTRSSYTSEPYFNADASVITTTVQQDGVTTTTVAKAVSIISGRETRTLWESLKAIASGAFGWFIAKGSVTP